MKNPVVVLVSNDFQHSTNRSERRQKLMASVGDRSHQQRLSLDSLQPQNTWNLGRKVCPD